MADSLRPRIRRLRQQSLPEVRELNDQANRLRRYNSTEALNLLEQAEQIDPCDNFTQGIKTLCFLQLRRYGEAVKAAIRNAELCVNNRSYGLLAQALLANGQREMALYYVPHAARMDGACPDEMILAEALRKQQRFGDALMQLERIEDGYPKFLCQAYCHLMRDQYVPALTTFMMAEADLRENWPAEIDYGDPRVRLWCGYLFLNEKVAAGTVASDKIRLVSTNLARVAARRLQNFQPARLADYQEGDYQQALKIANRL